MQQAADRSEYDMHPRGWLMKRWCPRDFEKGRHAVSSAWLLRRRRVREKKKKKWNTHSRAAFDPQRVFFYNFFLFLFQSLMKAQIGEPCRSFVYDFTFFHKRRAKIKRFRIFFKGLLYSVTRGSYWSSSRDVILEKGEVVFFHFWSLLIEVLKIIEIL